MTQSQVSSAYEMYLSGESVKDIAAAFGCSYSTMIRHIGKARREGAVAQAEVVVAGDKRTGRLVCTSRDGRQYDGTHVTADGETHRKRLVAAGPKMARTAWERWCADLDDECEFMARVERREPPAQGPGVPPDEPDREDGGADGVDCELDTEEQDVPDGEAALEAGAGRPEDKAGGVAYLIWCKAPRLRPYGLYQTMERAISEVERLNSVAAFLGSEGAFEVEEVEWR